MTDWKRIGLQSCDETIVPGQIVNAVVHDEIGAINGQTYYLVQIKAGDLINHHRRCGADDEYALLAWYDGHETAQFYGLVPGIISH